MGDADCGVGGNRAQRTLRLGLDVHRLVGNSRRPGSVVLADRAAHPRSAGNQLARPGLPLSCASYGPKDTAIMNIGAMLLLAVVIAVILGVGAYFVFGAFLIAS